MGDVTRRSHPHPNPLPSRRERAGGEGARGEAESPALLFYCQHSLGIGHLTRSFALAAALREHFRIVFLNGGRLPPGLPVPAGIEIIDLPALGMDDGHTVVSRDGAHDVAQAQAARRDIIDAAVRRRRPAVLLVELFPFGRKKFAGEIIPMIRAAKAQGAKVACSLRDILVDARPDQQHHDDRARWMTDRWFDIVLVHADRRLAKLDDSFRPTKPMRTPVHETGYVVPARDAAVPAPRGRHLLVSAGGGIVGGPLFELAWQARALMRDPLPLRIVAGPFLPGAPWRALREQVRNMNGIELVRQVPDMVAEMRHARASLSQCGYNTALDIVVSGVPALVVPYATATENEQQSRATRLHALGALRCAPTHALDAQALADELDALLCFEPRPAALDLDGAVRSAALLRQLAVPR